MRFTHHHIFMAEDGGADGGALDLAARLEGQKEEPETPTRVQSKYETQLSKEYQNDDFTGVEDLNKLYAGYRDLEKKSKDALTIPGKDSTPEEVKAFFTRIGMPETKEGYTFNNYGEEDSDGLKAMKDRLAEQAYRYGLTPSQANGIWKHELATIKEVNGKIIANQHEAKESFEPKYDALLKTEYPDDSKRAERRTYEENLYKEFVAETGLGDVLTKTGIAMDADSRHKLALYHEKRASKGIIGKQSTTLSEMDKLKKMFPKMAQDLNL